MNQYFECTKVEVKFLQQTKNIFVAKEIIKASPEQIFEVFEDAQAQTEWATPIKKVEWTSAKPYGIGTTRSVHMMGDVIGYQEFVEWGPGNHIAFTFVG